MAAVATLLILSRSPARPALPTPVQVAVSVDTRSPGPPVPRAFLGLSFEMSSLRLISTYSPNGSFVGLLRSLGSGVLRFGGVSADTRVAWEDAATPLPSWTSQGLDAGELRAVARLARASGWPVVLTLGLAHYDVRAAAREASAAERAFGPRLEGIEIGNEPDAYGHHGLRSEPWTPARYAAELRAYQHAIARVAPGVQFLGPDVSGSLAFATWGSQAARQARLAQLTGHHYPLGCHQVPAPTITRLLSPTIRVLEEDSLHRYMSISRSEGLGFRMDETNTVSCGGKDGISDTFASALWAVDYITSAMQAGVAGINLQGNPANCRGYSPVCAASPQSLAAGKLTAQPIFYALLLTRELIGDRPLLSTVHAPKGLNIAVHALLAPDGGLRIVLVDNEPPASRPVRVSLNLGKGFERASEISLSAPTQQARSGVTLGGETMGADGRWRAPASSPELPDHDGLLTLTLPA
ncbi:MAG TPA: glycosyl hydrolase family 79 C-terminal domain-containing protein, partial [Solirubrobacteraceae bacterium]